MDGGTSIPNGGTAHGGLTVSGWIDPGFAATGMGFYVDGKLWNNTSLGNVVINGNTFSGTIGRNDIFGYGDSAAGTLAIDVIASNGSGNASTRADSRLQYTVSDDFSASVPDIPKITLVTDAVGTITGPVTPGMVTDDSRPTISGTGRRHHQAVRRQQCHWISED